MHYHLYVFEWSEQEAGFKRRRILSSSRGREVPAMFINAS